ncbi:flagellar biosynthetic protein FliR [Salinisphaera sp. T31B1]|uniref:flagellar biosynthetic protein FliR n=1 Tax=Salinisphaera sp. T31B1 TaxID=727963 RepID=UPI0033401B22
MIEFTSDELTGWAMAFLWPFVRILAFVAVAPVFGENGLSRLGKIGIAVALALVIAPTVDRIPDVAPVSFTGVWLLVQQILIGSAIGLTMRVVFAAVQAAGDYVGLQMGLGFASFFSAAMGTNAMVLSQFLNTFAMLFFLAFDGHLIMVRILADTFTTLPIGAGGLSAAGWQTAALWGATVFTAGVGLALPLIAALLTINLTMGILNRASPQLSIFSVGFPLTLLAGLTVLAFMTPELGSVFSRMFVAGLEAMAHVAAALAGG